MPGMPGVPQTSRQQRETACCSDLGISIVFFTQQREQASPHSIVVATRIAGREAGREGAQKVISARRGAHDEEEPRTLEVRQQGELLQQPRLVEQPSVGVSGHKPRVPERGAEGNELALRLGCVTTPDIGPELGDARRGRASIAVVYTRVLPRLAVTPARVSIEDVTTSSASRARDGVVTKSTSSRKAARHSPGRSCSSAATRASCWPKAYSAGAQFLPHVHNEFVKLKEVFAGVLENYYAL